MSRQILPAHFLKMKWLMHNRAAFKEMDSHEREIVKDLQKHTRAPILMLSCLDLIYSRIRIVKGIK